MYATKRIREITLKTKQAQNIFEGINSHSTFRISIFVFASKLKLVFKEFNHDELSVNEIFETLKNKIYSAIKLLGKKQTKYNKLINTSKKHDFIIIDASINEKSYTVKFVSKHSHRVVNLIERLDHLVFTLESLQKTGLLSHKKAYNEIYESSRSIRSLMQWLYNEVEKIESSAKNKIKEDELISV